MNTCENPSGGTEAEPLVARVTPRHDQCGKPGHGIVYLTARAEVDAALMSVSADCDYIDAAVDLTLDEARHLAASLLAAVDSVEAGWKRASSEGAATNEQTNTAPSTSNPELVVDRPPVRVLKDECLICAMAGRPCGGHAMTCAVAGCSACMGVTWERAQ